MFQFSSQNDVVCLSFFLGDTRRGREGVHATKRIYTREKARHNEQEAQGSAFIHLYSWGMGAEYTPPRPLVSPRLVLDTIATYSNFAGP